MERESSWTWEIDKEKPKSFNDGFGDFKERESLSELREVTCRG